MRSPRASSGSSTTHQAQVYVSAIFPYRVRGRLSLVRRTALAALAQAHPEPRGAYEWSIRLSNDEELHRLNRQFRGMDKPTDVLSFSTPLYPPLAREEVPSPPLTKARSGLGGVDEGIAQYLGDIVISMERCTAQAAAGGHSVEDELALLVVHGTLHLLGYDHDTKTRKARMWSAQARVLQSLGIKISVP